MAKMSLKQSFRAGAGLGAVKKVASNLKKQVRGVKGLMNTNYARFGEKDAKGGTKVSGRTEPTVSAPKWPKNKKTTEWVKKYNKK